MVIDVPDDPLTNLRFADDVLLVALSKVDIAKMISDLQPEAMKYGLEVHMGKTNVLTNSSGQLPERVLVAGAGVDVVPAAGTDRYMGWQLCMGSFHETEFSSSVNAAWRCFAQFKDILCSRSYPLRSRLRLFHAVVTPTALYACECWTMTSNSSARLRTAWRK